MKKPKRIRFEVLPSKQGWCVTRNGTRLCVGGWTKRAAVAWAVYTARAEQPSQLFIKGEDGRVQDERTYGADPFPPRG